jgi:16S rRNA (guanine966-N2)-methyltransferase
MRIIGGALGGRRLPAPPGGSTRPTSDRVREAVASALASRGAIEGARVLDLYAGTGALAFEALSRGAVRACCVERDRRAAAAIEATARTLGLAARLEVVSAPLAREPAPALVSRLARAAGPGGFALVFVDPPYAEIDDALPLLARLAVRGVIAPGALVVLEHATRQPPHLADDDAFFTFDAAYRYGDTAVLFLRRRTDAEASDP